jgi:aminopeptidase YwaD
VSRFADETWAFLERFTEEMSPRESATAEEEAAAEYLAKELESLGYEVQTLPFTFERMASERSLRLPDGETLFGIPLRKSGLGTVSGPLVHVDLARAEDIPAGGLAGRVALIRRGEILFEEKVSRVAGAGAVGAVIYNNAPRLFTGVLENQADIPAISLSREDGERLVEMLDAGDLEVTLSLEATTYTSRNLVAELPGDSGKDRVLVVGAHYDTTPNTQGANDNGSGVAALMSIARELADGPPLPFKLRFLLFGAEEVGLFGSNHYVSTLDQDEIDSIVAMINLDVPGSGHSLEVIGDTSLTAEAVRYGRELGILIRREQGLDGASSDHAPFRERGVPVMFILADDLSRINSPRDNIEFVNPNRMGETVAVVLNAIRALASDN